MQRTPLAVEPVRLCVMPRDHASALATIRVEPRPRPTFAGRYLTGPGCKIRISGIPSWWRGHYACDCGRDTIFLRGACYN